MAKRYIELNGPEFEKFLADAGFYRTLVSDEIVYVKDDKNANIKIKVYTSVSENSNIARPVGADAIRVNASFSNEKTSFGLYKGSRVYRTGSQTKVQERTMERIKEAEVRITEWKLEQEVKRQAQPPSKKIEANQEYVGEIGQSVKLTLEVVGRKPWNKIYLFLFKDVVGHNYGYWSQLDILQIGERYDLSCKIKSHSMFAGKCITYIEEVKGKRVIM